MHICFIEDTQLHGGTQIWVSEAVRAFLAAGHEVTVLTGEGGFNAHDTAATDARLVTYDVEAVVARDARHRTIWTEALEPADVAVCTVHPPRDGFHCSVFAAECIAGAGLDTVLEPKTGHDRAGVSGRVLRTAVRHPLPRDLHHGLHTPLPHRRLRRASRPGQPDLPGHRRGDVHTGRLARRRGAPALSGPCRLVPCDRVRRSFEERKGQLLLLDALAQVRDDLPAVQLLFVGDGPDEALLRRRVGELDLEQHVSFFPFTDEPVFVFEVIDVLALPSTHKEGLPNVLLEALAMGVPVVSSRLAGTPEVVIDEITGLLVDPGDIEGLAAGIRRLGADDQARHSMSAAGQLLMREDFDKRRQFDAFLHHFEAVAGGELASG